jgi:FAD/FMN-containing dehydrogenase
MGGHGPITNRHGLGADQFLEFKVVTADGELRVANKVSNQGNMSNSPLASLY